MQNMRIDFEIPDNAKKGSVTLAVDKGNSVTKFDDLRIVERQTDIMNPDKQTVIKQDFEDTQAVGLYPVSYTHLDVYKRQNLDYMRLCGRLLIFVQNGSLAVFQPGY